MINKKTKLLFLSAVLAASTVSAQDYPAYIYDSASSTIPKRGVAQQNEFNNYNYAFPAKPRNMWEIGVSGGLPLISSDVQSKLPTFGFSAHVRKALGYVFSLRAQYFHGTAKGLSWLASENFSKNAAWDKYASIQRSYNGPLQARYGWGGAPSATGADFVYYNYKTELQDLSLQGLFSTNNIRFHKAKTGFVLYGGAGIGATTYKTMVNAYNESTGQTYATLFKDVFNSRNSGVYKNRKDVTKALKNGMDDTYETVADRQGDRRPSLGGRTLKPSGSVIAGIAFRLGKRINLAIENRHTFVKDDLLDGQRWQEHAYGDPVLTRDYDSYNYTSLGLNFNLGAKAVEPLYWLNPLDYVYGELNNPRHLKVKPTFDDADGDGVVDDLDREPNTPAGCPVDTHGVSLDTDGDGVPDCRDKQKITPTECQPVDADGVGKCPPPPCCDSLGRGNMVSCPTSYPSLTYTGRGATLSRENKSLLDQVASQLRNNPTCTITVTGYPDASKAGQKSCQDRMAVIVRYLTETGNITENRISTNCDVNGAGARNTFDIRSN